MRDYEEVRTPLYESGRERRVTTFNATHLISLLLGLLEVAIAVRFVFKMNAINAANPFAAFLYNMTDFFVAPFSNLAGTPAIGNTVLEISSLIAMSVYLLLGWVLELIVLALVYHPSGSTISRQASVTDHNRQ